MTKSKLKRAFVRDLAVAAGARASVRSVPECALDSVSLAGGREACCAAVATLARTAEQQAAAHEAAHGPPAKFIDYLTRWFGHAAAMASLGQVARGARAAAAASRGLLPPTVPPRNEDTGLKRESFADAVKSLAATSVEGKSSEALAKPERSTIASTAKANTLEATNQPAEDERHERQDAGKHDARKKGPKKKRKRKGNDEQAEPAKRSKKKIVGPKKKRLTLINPFSSSTVDELAPPEDEVADFTASGAAVPTAEVVEQSSSEEEEEDDDEHDKNDNCDDVRALSIEEATHVDVDSSEDEDSADVPGAGEIWIYQPSNGLPMDVRRQPAIDGERAGFKVYADDAFRVRRVLNGGDGILFLELADGRGWLFSMKPGVGNMCWRLDESDDSMAARVEKVDLPNGWSAYHDDKGRGYYANIRTGESSWTRPASSPEASTQDPSTTPAISKVPTDALEERRRALLQKLDQL